MTDPDDAGGGAALVELAARAFLRRQSGTEQPDGAFTPKGVWVVSPAEQRGCCGRVRASAKWPRAVEAHCKSAAHVAALFDVPEKDLRRTARLLDQQ